MRRELKITKLKIEKKLKGKKIVSVFTIGDFAKKFDTAREVIMRALGLESLESVFILLDDGTILHFSVSDDGSLEIFNRNSLYYDKTILKFKKEELKKIKEENKER